MKIALLGDSIRQNYAPKTAELLGSEYEVFSPEDNCRFAKYLLRCVFDYRAELKSARIVHFNCGHWDLNNLFGDGPFTSLEEYGQTVLKIAELLLSKGKVVIFATTTPTHPTNVYNKNDVIVEFNNYIVPKLQELGVIINDLHGTLFNDIEKYIRADDAIHLTEAGIEACAKQTEYVIRQAGELLDIEEMAQSISDENDDAHGFAVLL